MFSLNKFEEKYEELWESELNSNEFDVSKKVAADFNALSFALSAYTKESSFTVVKDPKSGEQILILNWPELYFKDIFITALDAVLEDHEGWKDNIQDSFVVGEPPQDTHDLTDMARLSYRVFGLTMDALIGYHTDFDEEVMSFRMEDLRKSYEYYRNNIEQNLPAWDQEMNEVFWEHRDKFEKAHAEFVQERDAIKTDMKDVLKKVFAHDLEKFPEQDREVIAIIQKYHGAIFGGYLRDLYSGVKAADVDVIMFKQFFESFNKEVIALGYERKETEKDMYRYTTTIAGRIDIEVVVDDNETYGNVILGPSAEPDATVNLLNYFDGNLHNWMGMGMEPQDIIRMIQRKETYVFANAEPERVEKIRQKGYKILGTISDY